MRRKATVCAAAVAVLAGCAAPAPKMTTADIDAASEAGRLQALYDQLAANEAGVSDPERREALLEEVGARLAERRIAAVQDALDSVRLDDGLYPLRPLGQQIEALAPVERWQPKRYAREMSRLRAARDETDGAIADIKAELESLGPGQPARRLELLGRLAELNGTGSQAEQQYTDAREQTLKDLYSEVERALERGEHQQALNRLETLEAIQPGYRDTDALRRQARVGLQAQRFRAAVQAGKPAQAWSLFRSFTADEARRMPTGAFRAPAMALADYYRGVAEQALARGASLDAYRAVGKARALASWVGENEDIAGDVTTALVDRIYKQATEAGARELAGVELGYLLAIRELDPDFADLSTLIEEARARVYDSAVLRVSTAAFDASEDNQAFGDTIGAQVTHFLAQSLPNAIRIVEREQLKAIMRERDMQIPDFGDTGGRLASADYLIQGRVLEATVDSEVKEGRQTKRVVTGHERRPNPQWQQWKDAGGAEENEPPKTIEVPVREDISYTVKRHQKKGIVSASYRIIEASSAEVLHTDSVTVEREAEDTSTEGVEIGEFRQAFKLAELPSDIDMLNGLADRLAERIGEHLVDVLQDPQDDYLARCQDEAGKENFIAAATACANAYVLMTRQSAGDGHAGALEALKHHALAAGIGAASGGEAGA